MSDDYFDSKSYDHTQDIESENSSTEESYS
jgi:hypothetical protein